MPRATTSPSSTSSRRAFDRLPATFRGNAVRGDGTDEDTLRRVGAEGADLFLALTEGDNRNIMAAQLAVEALGIPRVYAKVNDPVRAQAYAELGIGTICRTTMMADGLLTALGQPVDRRAVDPRGRRPPASGRWRCAALPRRRQLAVAADVASARRPRAREA